MIRIQSAAAPWITARPGTSCLHLAKYMVDLLHYTLSGVDELSVRLSSDARIDKFVGPRITSLSR